MKKKILALVLCLLLIIVPFSLTGCNKQVFDTQYTFSNAYVKIGEEWVDLKISKWNDYDGEQIQLILTDGTIMVVSSNNCILYQGELPKTKE